MKQIKNFKNRTFECISNRVFEHRRIQNIPAVSCSWDKRDNFNVNRKKKSFVFYICSIVYRTRDTSIDEINLNTFCNFGLN